VEPDIQHHRAARSQRLFGQRGFRIGNRAHIGTQPTQLLCHDAPAECMVLDQEQLCARQRRLLRALDGGRIARDSADRQSQGEATAAPMYAVRGQVAAHGNGQLARNRQAQASAAALLAILSLLERAEQ